MTRSLYHEYVPAPGARITGTDARVIGKRFEALEEELRRPIKATDVLQDAIHRRSPLHKFFEWNDSKAAKRWRLEQARMLIRSIHVVVKSNGCKETMRAFINVERPDLDGSCYVRLQRVLTEPDLYRQMLDNALEELHAFKLKYARLKELRPVFKVIDSIEKDRIG